MHPVLSTMSRPLVVLSTGAMCTLLLVAGAGSPARSPLRHGVLDPGLPTAAGMERVIVSAAAGAASELGTAVHRLGGRVERTLPYVNAIAATVPGRSLRELAASPGVVAVTADRTAHFTAVAFDAGSTGSNFVRTTGAAASWAVGNYGRGVGVAVIDTGVSPMRDLAGRVVYGPDLSGEGTLIDSYGHGTVMAGIIAGAGADSAHRAGGTILGVAPEATVVAVKVAGRNGAVDVSTILQAFHWVSAYARQYNIRVVNLSFGVPSTQRPAVDPLNYAVERLWRQGITVVVAAGNSGPDRGTVLKPGDDPVVLTVGAYDDRQDSSSANDTVPAWSSRGPTAQGVAKPDIVAPGRYLIAARSYASAIETEHPEAWRGRSYIRGSGTSQATAVTSGLAALMLGNRPSLTPDQVKGLFVRTAAPIVGIGRSAQGAGRVQLAGALNGDATTVAEQAPSGTGLGSLEASRGPAHVSTDCRNGTVEIRGEIDVRCEAWDPAVWAGSAWTGSAWTGSAWTGSAWTGSAWTNASWTGSAWTGGTWAGSAWTGSAWTGSAWTGSAWTGSAWTGSAWTGSAWTGSAWTGFLTAFWGDHPAVPQRVAGEVSSAPVAAVEG